MRKIIKNPYFWAFFFVWAYIASMVAILMSGCGTAQHQGGTDFQLDENCMPKYSSAREQVEAGELVYKRNADGSCEVTVKNVRSTQGRESSVSSGTGEVIKETPGTIKTFLPAVLGW